MTKKIEFCKTLFSSSHDDNDLEIILTKNFNEKLIEPTLLEMTNMFSNEFLYYKWYGQYFNNINYLKRAYELNPIDKSTKNVLMTALEKELWNSTHHLPDKYLGEFNSDFENIELGIKICNSLEKSAHDDFMIRLRKYKNQIELYKNCN